MRQRIARKRILTTAVVLFVAAVAALMTSVRPQWQQEVGPPPINLGTARMQAEVMAELIDLRPTPPGKPPVPPIPMKGLSSPMLTGNSGFATTAVPLADIAPAHFEPRAREPDVPFAVMEWTAPSCHEGEPAQVCQVRHSVVEWRDDDSAASFQLQQHLEATLQVVNRRAVRVPDLAFELAHVRAQRMTWDELQQRRARGIEGCMEGPGNPDLGVVYLQRPVFSLDGKWAMASVASDLCSGGMGMRVLYLLHRRKGGWERVRAQPFGYMRLGNGLWPALTES
ncbi:energy transducer TonB [Stenotrophomonas maltophilia]|uniref:energy transducer TonB n=1 Tax=Stenotrophomonas maltophilia TaxID=40324 RepID=UPI0015DD5F51|nr:energy transducer TonB [Stenotrophomonas maltophilia]MBA0283133.1 energy transducer TonB [Stenotrophomonas maltophilia]MBA0346553.1 energy transducer TonB [Stenotrophomonas maltophilia]MBA0359581.1 energy transducer TonB [Stenotrophomonas maltophilia]MBA0521517.1 energy transducer TonB [Stenotrophomonas maltophilia]